MRNASAWKAGSTALLAFLLVLGAEAQNPRTVHGTVVDSDGRAIKGAVVQMKDLQSLMIRSFITRDDGTFQFMGLNTDTDYELRAHRGYQSSGKKMVSRFDSKETVEVVLVIAVRTT